MQPAILLYIIIRIKRHCICVSEQSSTSRVALRRLTLLEHRPIVAPANRQFTEFSLVSSLVSAATVYGRRFRVVFTFLFTAVNVVFVGVSGVVSVFLESSVD